MAKISSETIARLCELSCEAVAEKLGIEVWKHKALCFMHDDHHPSMTFSSRNGEFWRCFVCGKGGNAINLVMEYLNLNFLDSCCWLGRNFDISVETSSSSKKTISSIRSPRKMKQQEEKPFSTDVAEYILDNNQLTIQGKSFLLGQRCFNADIIKQLKIVSIDESSLLVERMSKIFELKTLLDSGFFTVTNKRVYFRMFTPCLIFPYYDQNRNLVGMQSRYLGSNKEAPRFQFISDQRSRLFNLPILNQMKSGEELYISEGITDCIALLSSRKKAVAIPSATILPLTDLIKLKAFKLHMYPDQDDAGRKAYVNLRRFFINHYATLKAEQLPQGFKDYSDYYIAMNKKIK